MNAGPAIGRDLVRPECVIGDGGNGLYVSDARGGVVRIYADGAQEPWIEEPDTDYENAPNGPLRFVTGDVVNGLALGEGAVVIAANIGRGRVEAVFPGGRRRTLFDDAEGQSLRFANHVCADHDGRLWISVSANSSGALDSGFVALSIGGGAPSIVATGLMSANECRVFDDSLYVVETAARRISRFAIGANGTLGRKRTFGPEDLGGLPDGICFDAEGALWGVLIGRDIVFRIGCNGRVEHVFTGGDQAWFDAHEHELLSGALSLDQVVPHGYAPAPLFGSVEFFGGSLVIGSLCGRTLPTISVNARAAPAVRWPAAAIERALKQHVVRQ